MKIYNEYKSCKALKQMKPPSSSDFYRLRGNKGSGSGLEANGYGLFILMAKSVDQMSNYS